MNTKDYKEIANILFYFKSYISIETHSLICNKFADCFEREGKTEWEKEHPNDIFIPSRVRTFNKKQFLKDCGIE